MLFAGYIFPIVEMASDHLKIQHKSDACCNVKFEICNISCNRLSTYCFALIVELFTRKCV